MYDLRDYEFWKPSTTVKSSMTWRSALVLAACGSQFLEYRAHKPVGKDPARNFPGFDLARIERDLRECLGPEARGIRATGAWNEAAIQLTVLTRTMLICFRPDPSTKDRPFFTAYEKGEELFTSLGRSGVLPYLLSPHSKPYWKSLLILGAMSSGARFIVSEPTPRTSRERRPSLEGATSLSPSQIEAALSLLRKGFRAKANVGASVSTLEFKVDFIEKEGAFKLPPHLVFSESELEGIDDMSVSPRTPAVAKEPSSIMVQTPASPHPLHAEVLRELGPLLSLEAEALGVSQEDLTKSLVEEVLSGIRSRLRESAQTRFDAQMSRLEEAHQKKLASLREEFGHFLVSPR